jgi:glycosyltransferase involved in cell wall biosynthesis
VASDVDVDVERDVTIVVKTFERPAALLRLVASIRRFYPRIAVYVVDDSAEPLDPVPEDVTRYWHLPFNVGASAGRNFGLAQVETEYVLFVDDDLVFKRRTNLEKMARALASTRFDIVSCQWVDHDAHDLRTGVSRGIRRFEGTIDVVDGMCVHRYRATRGEMDGLPVFDVVHQFFMARRARLGDDPWDARLKTEEHSDFFLTMKERGLLATRLPDVFVYH